ncbi:unnamed protein product [Eruca vesicaria subsp. sativa]|uniref:Uncharacterized protein n=1 Tax=Eruca vesicaria subsp. sativa TaxID=29727 RepID=A0ABC8K8T0_ERUVS|nr:unnamed protein product [Eruca vesicaria subsp. sativa]CAH8355038.1 unnamed protein product [Eruca vesicaria subsp. sativa]
MGNCLFGGLGDMEEYLPTKVIKPDGGVLEFFSPITAGSDELKTFVGNYHVRSNSESLPMITPYGMSLDYNRRVLKRSYTNVFSRKTRHKEKKTRKRMRNKGDIWKVKLVINTEELLQILSEEGRTNELIESVRAVAKCENVVASSITSSSSELNYLSVVQV